MKFKLTLFFALLSATLATHAQTDNKKYQGLLWEISGNGLQKPSYLYGTMHVSSKLAFHLGDSFFIALNNVDYVALEINPDTWLQDMLDSEPYSLYSINQRDGDYYDWFSRPEGLEARRRKAITSALSRDMSIINHLLFRYERTKENFEEDTYLDLYIFQTGKKLKKKVTGLERMAEVNEIVAEAYRLRDEEYEYKKRDYDDFSLSGEDRLEDAYRRGDLDMIDSLNIEDGTPGYLENMLYKRNRIMVDRMDSIMKHGPLFTGIGAAHLPGEKGAIELLRKKGYTVRAVMVGERDAKQKQKIDEMKFDVKFSLQKSYDGYMQVETPGKLFEFPGDDMERTYLLPEMANGAYYTVSRIKTFSDMLGQDQDYIYKSIDSLLYENIPGKILKQKKIEKFGFKGFDISTRTRRGDIHRYEILITPLEIFIFKLGATGDYAKGKEGDKFFNSVLISSPSKTEWQNFESPDGFFSVRFPHKPLHYNDTSMMSQWSGNQEYMALDFSTGTNYSIKRAYDFSNSSFDADSLILEKMAFYNAEDEDYEETERKFMTINGMHVLDARYTTPDGKKARLRYIYKVPLKFVLVAKYNIENAEIENFFNSFALKSKTYSDFQEYNDTDLHFKVTTAYVPKKSAFSEYSYLNKKSKPHESEEKNASFYPPKSTEGINVSYYRYGKYYYSKDSAQYWTDEIDRLTGEGDFIIKNKKLSGKNGYTVVELDLRDTGSSKAIKTKIMYKKSIWYSVDCVYDTAIGTSDFINKFYETFEPYDSSSRRSIFDDNTALFVTDLGSSDSATRAQAKASINQTYIRDSTFNKWRTIIDTTQPTKKGYLEYKADLIKQLSTVKKKDASDYLRNLYEKVGDTSTFQLAILQTLSTMETAESFKALKELLLTDAPLGNEYSLNDVFFGMRDSLLLGKTMFPDLFKLYSLDEYKSHIVSLLGKLLDSNTVNADIYKDYFTVLLSEAKNELKRKSSSEEEDDEDHLYDYGYYNSGDLLEDLSHILIKSYADKGVKSHFDKLLQVKSKKLKMSTAMLLLKNNYAVEDTLLENLAADDTYRSDLYDELEGIKRLDKFPAKYKNQEAMVKSVFKNNIGYSYSAPDTMVILDKKYVEFKGLKGYVYFIKYRKKDGDTWYTGLCGIQPADTVQVSTNSTITVQTYDKLNDSDNIDKIFRKELKKALLNNRKSRYSYYDEETYSNEE